MNWTIRVGMVVLASASVAAAPQPSNKTPITISGCVAQGEGSSKVLLTSVRMTQGTPPAGISPDQIYLRLDNAKKLAEHVGHEVSVAGTADFADMDKGTLEVEPNDDSTVSVKLTSERKTAAGTTTPTDPTVAQAPVGTSGKVQVPTYKMNVESVTMVAASCAK